MSWDNYKYGISTIDDPEQFKLIYPEKLYKYRDWNNPYHRNILTQQQVYFSPADGFKDPFDCHFPLNFDFSYEAAEGYFFHDYRVNRKSQLNDEQIRSIARYFYKEGFATEEQKERKRQLFYKLFNDRLGILCLCRSSDVYSMWKEYANNFDGFCVGFSIREHLDEIRANSIRGTDIIYVPMDTPPLEYIWSHQAEEDYTTSIYARLINTKYEDFSHENEYRLIKYPSNLDSMVLSEGERLYILPKPTFKEVIMGCDMSKVIMNEIIEVCHSQQLEVNFKVASPNKDDTVLIQDY